MSIGGIYLLDAKDAPADFGFEQWRDLVASRLQCSKVFRQRLVEVPWGLSHPSWINDPEFVLGDHLPHLALAEPGGEKELTELAAEMWSHMLRRDRPLWEMAFVDGVNSVPGLSPGSWALISRVHHAAVDGGAATEMMTALLDMSPQVRIIEEEDTWQSENLPSTLGMVSQSWSKLGSKAVDLAGFTAKAVSGAARLKSDKRMRKLNPPPRLMSAPRCIFNGPVDSARVYDGVVFDFERIRALRPIAPGATVNDVVLAVCSGGLRNYLLAKDQLPAEPLVAMAPISVRQEEQKGDEGNQVSAMLVALATDIEDPVERLRCIHDNTRSSKVHASALPANQITEFIPSETLAAAARVYTRTRLGSHLRPFFNLTITNVPGPPFPLYVAGARISRIYGMAPILDGLGLLLVVFSYNGKISIGITSCHDMVPDPDRLAECFATSLQELERAAETVDLTAPGREAGKVAETVFEKDDPLYEFRKAERALDAAIESLEGNHNEKPGRLD